MSNLFNQASLVLVPSGYKAGKVYSQVPTNGDGDLTFTRSNDTATRVNSAGLIEKVRTNLLTYSEEFDDADWAKDGGGTGSAPVVTANAIISPDGTSNAEQIVFDAGAGTSSANLSIMSQPLTLTIGLKYAGSIYLKGQLGGEQIMFRHAAGATYTLLTLTTEWVRYDIIEVAGGTSGNFQIGIRQGLVGTINSTATIFAWGAQFETGDIATDYIPTTTTAVSVGMTANVPRLDYSGGGCPKLILEPQRTNLVTFSEQFDNAAWSLSRTSAFGSGSVVNAAISPDGTQNAEYIQQQAGQTQSGGVFLLYTMTVGVTYTLSVYAKRKEQNAMRIGAAAGVAGLGLFASFDLVNGVIGNVSSGLTTKIEDYGNGWYRCSVTFTKVDATGNGLFLYQADSPTSTTAVPLDGVYIWGAQVEEGSYSTSYIPTYGAASTRGQDAAELNPSTLLGATTGSWYIEIDDLTFEFVGTSVPTNYIGDSQINFLGYEARSLDNKIISFVKEESNAVTTLYSFTPTTKHKACFVWNGTSLKLFVDGVKQYDAGGFTQPANWDELKFNSSTREAQQTINQTILFPTALTDSEIAIITGNQNYTINSAYAAYGVASESPNCVQP